MPEQHPRPTEKTAKELYGNAHHCGYPECKEPLFRIKPGEAIRSLNSRIAHICARRENGPRWDPSMTSEENRSVSNLLLLCLPHADQVDLQENEGDYPPELLRHWKEQQLASYDDTVGGWSLTDEEAADILDLSTHSEIAIQAHSINLGGFGGNAIGAAGGGGGAIGPGALGGPGGPVGNINLDGQDGAIPGAGGGGGGSIAPGAVLPGASQIGTEGKGHSSGLDGLGGGDTTFSIGDEIPLRASGGSAGLAGTGIRTTSDRLSVSVMLLGNYVEAPGLVNVVGGGWQNFSILNFHQPITLAFLIVFEAGGVEVGEYGVQLEARNPDGASRGLVRFPVTVEEVGEIVRIPRTVALATDVDSLGVWTFELTTSIATLAKLDLLIKRTSSA